MPGVGISIGLTRFFYQIKKEAILQETKKAISEILVAPMEEKNLSYALKVGKILREAGINTEVFLEEKKIKAKLKYADKLNIPYVLVLRRRRRRK